MTTFTTRRAAVRAFCVCSAVALTCCASVAAQPDRVPTAAPPDRVQSDGGQALTRVSQATRSRLFGLIDIYRVSLFAPRGVSGLSELQGANTPKALEVEVLYDGSLPDNIPDDWKAELEPALKKAQQETLHQAYARLRPNDVIRIAYTPHAGTTVLVSGTTVLTTQNYNLMAAFLDIWLGQTPTSEELKQALLEGLERAREAPIPGTYHARWFTERRIP